MITFAPMLGQHEWKWMQARTHVIACEDTKGIVAYDKDNRIVACCATDSFTVDSCNVHLALDNPMVLRRGFLNEIARWLFIECGRKRVFGLVPDNNERALKLNAHIGFHEVARVPHAVSEGIGYVVLELHKDDCKWLQVLKEAA